MFRVIAFAAILLCPIAEAVASCMATEGARTQTVALSGEGKQLDGWVPARGEIHRARLPGGLEVGVQVDPATPEKYREILTRARSIEELVKIDIFDLSGATPRLLSTTRGGANSKQGFGPRGGATGIAD